MKHKGQVIWFEIPVTDLDRAITFYSEVLSIPIEKNKFLDEEYGVLNKDEDTIKGVLVSRKDLRPGPGIALFFYVIDLSESLSEVKKLGGEILTGKTLLKQKNQQGQTTISGNMIDGNVGYYAEILDCDGNRISLYSNS